MLGCQLGRRVRMLKADCIVVVAQCACRAAHRGTQDGMALAQQGSQVVACVLLADSIYAGSVPLHYYSSVW